VNLGTSCANLDPGISGRCSSPDLSPSSRTFVELTPRQLAPTVGIAATGFCYPGGILQIFHRQDQQIFHRQDQQILRLPTAVRSLLVGSSRPSTSTIGEYIIILFVTGQKTAISANRRNQQSGPSSKKKATSNGSKFASS
jgi:hypothetical protein